MEARGEFSGNPANADSHDSTGTSLYRGPVKFPRMLYHPTGAERITNPGEYQATPMGPRLVGQQSELISQIVNDETEEKKLLDAGWHKHPADAMRAAGKDAPQVSPSRKIADLEEQIRKLEAERNATADDIMSANNSTGTLKSNATKGD